VLTEQRIRNRHAQLLGTIEAERAAGTDAGFAILDIHSVEVLGHTYATLGASKGPLQHEIAMDATEAFPPYSDAIEAVVRGAPALAPGAVVPHAIPETPFTALLCLPFDDKEGSFSLRREGGPPYAFRLAPLTAAEQALAEREPERVTELLRAAYAFRADRYRPCLVDVPPPTPAARTEVARQRRQERAALLALQADVRREHAPRVRVGLFMSQRRQDYRLYPGSHVALVACVEDFIRKALEPYTRHPASITYLFGEFIYVTFATHPDAVRMLDRALDPRHLPRPAAGDDLHRQAAASRDVTEALAVAVARCHPGESEAAILARAQPAIRDALATLDPADEIPVENHVWATMLPVMYESLDALKQPATRGMPGVFRRVARSEALLEYEIDPRPPMLRLKEISARIATELVTAYAAGLRGQLPD